jgi:hypothetical protein
VPASPPAGLARSPVRGREEARIASAYNRSRFTLTPWPLPHGGISAQSREPGDKAQGLTAIARKSYKPALDRYSSGMTFRTTDSARCWFGLSKGLSSLSFR